MNTENEKILVKLRNILGIDDVYIRIKQDLIQTFKALGVPDGSVNYVATQMLQIMLNAETLEGAEEQMKALFAGLAFDGKTVKQLIDESLVKRVDTIYDQINPHIQEDHILDYGCGSGLLVHKFNANGKQAGGADINDFRQSGLEIPFFLLKGYHLPVASEYFDCTVLTNVLHHDSHNEKIIAEATRKTAKRLVVIETIAEGEGQGSLLKDWNRMFVLDVVWNRFFNSGNIPVPGAYDTPSNWVARIEAHGWKCVFQKDLGIDQPTIRDRHYLMVFDKAKKKK